MIIVLQSIPLRSLVSAMSTTTNSDNATRAAQEVPQQTAKEAPQEAPQEAIQSKSPAHLEGASLVLVSIGLALAVFCLGLVRKTSLSPTRWPSITLLTLQGSIHSRHGHPQNHERIQLPRRRSLVRLGLPPGHLLLPAHVRQAIRRIRGQMGLCRRPGPL